MPAILPKTMKRELVLYVPMSPDNNRRARVTVSVLEEHEDDNIMPGTIREPMVGELDEITASLVMRHYNLEDEPQI